MEVSSRTNSAAKLITKDARGPGWNAAPSALLARVKLQQSSLDKRLLFREVLFVRNRQFQDLPGSAGRWKFQVRNPVSPWVGNPRWGYLQQSVLAVNARMTSENP
jgi:hypothetical protein